MTQMYYNVEPRYSPGSPAQVSRRQAFQVADAEQDAYRRTLTGVYGPELKARAEKLGLDGIVEMRCVYSRHWVGEDMITGVRTDSRGEDAPTMGRTGRRDR